MQVPFIFVLSTGGCNVILGKYDPTGPFPAECNAGMWLFPKGSFVPQCSVVQLEKSTPDSLPE